MHILDYVAKDRFLLKLNVYIYILITRKVQLYWLFYAKTTKIHLFKVFKSKEN